MEYKYSRIPFSRASEGNENWVAKSGGLRDRPFAGQCHVTMSIIITGGSAKWLPDMKRAKQLAGILQTSILQIQDFIGGGMGGGGGGCQSLWEPGGAC